MVCYLPVTGQRCDRPSCCRKGIVRVELYRTIKVTEITVNFAYTDTVVHHRASGIRLSELVFNPLIVMVWIIDSTPDIYDCLKGLSFSSEVLGFGDPSYRRTKRPAGTDELALTTDRIYDKVFETTWVTILLAVCAPQKAKPYKTLRVGKPDAPPMVLRQVGVLH